MCEIPKMPKICNYNRDKMVIKQNEVVWNKKHQKHRGRIFAMNSEFRCHSKIARHREIQKFRYDSSFR